MTAEEYMERLYKALLIYFSSAGSPLPMRTGGEVETQNIYAGREGCLRLAREFGAGLKNYAEEERENVDAIGDEIEIAIYELKAAELRLNMLLREVKEAKKKVTA